MIYLVAIIAGLVAGAALGLCVGLGAAQVFESVGGTRDGGPGMAGMFLIGPFGVVAGFLFGFGAVLRWGGGSLGVANGTWIGGGAVLAIAAGLVLFASVFENNLRGGQKADYNFNFEVNAPAGLEIEKLKWKYLGEVTDGPDGPVDGVLWTPNVEADGTKTAGSAIQMLDNPAKRGMVLQYEGEPQETFEVAYPERVTKATEWSQWQTGRRGVKFRWRMASAR